MVVIHSGRSSDVRRRVEAGASPIGLHGVGNLPRDGGPNSHGKLFRFDLPKPFLTTPPSVGPPMNASVKAISATFLIRAAAPPTGEHARASEVYRGRYLTPELARCLVMVTNQVEFPRTASKMESSDARELFSGAVRSTEY